MPMRYAHEPDVLAQLKIKAGDTAAIDRVTRLENGLCDAFDAKVGRSFASPAPPVAETRAVYSDGGALLRLEPRARSVEAVAVGGTWDGLVWADETVLDAADWWEIVGPVGPGGIIAIEAADFVWTGPVRVTAVWEDQAIEVVPDDVREALTFITVDEYRTRNASPAGEIGPDGLVVPVRNPWRFELVRTAIRNHQVRRVRVGV